jgi:hypothetical protein
MPPLAPLWKRLGGFFIDMVVSLGPVVLASLGVLLESRAEPGAAPLAFHSRPTALP